MLQAPLTFRLYQSVKFNRPVDKVKDYISPGGYAIRVKNEDGSIRSVRFDFEDSETCINKDDPTIADIMQKNPDYATFEDLNELNEYMLRNIVGVEEWFIYTGEPDDVTEGETPLKPVSVIDPVFEVIPLIGEIFQILVTVNIVPDSNFPNEADNESENQ